jgi:hypothetical protein
MTPRLAIAVLAASLLLAGCGGDDDPPDPAPGLQRAAADLEIVAADRGRRVDASLRCDGAQESARGFAGANAHDLCHAAIRLAPYLAGAPDPDRACTQIYGGPQTARVTGTIRGRRIDRSFSRTDGCQIADWDRAKVLLPISVK